LPSPDGEVVVERNNQALHLSYPHQDQTITLSFAQDSISSQGVNWENISWRVPSSATFPVEQTSNQLRWQTPDGHTLIVATINCQQDQSCQVSFESDFEGFEPRQQPALLFPEKSGAADPTNSLIFAHNPIAMAGRNPIRIVVIPLNQAGSFANLLQPLTLDVADPSIESRTDPIIVKDSTVQFYDFASHVPARSTVTITSGSDTLATIPVIFAPNCTQQTSYCLTHPRHTWWFIRLKWQEVIVPKISQQLQNVFKQ
jgi:hypothetical protein